jgi:hypothetical protein
MKNVRIKNKLSQVTYTLLVLLLVGACGKQQKASGADTIRATSSKKVIKLTSSAQDDYNIPLGSVIQLYVDGGQAPYTFAIRSGHGTVNASTGVFTASSTTGGSVAIRVTDATGAQDTLYLYVSETPASNPGVANKCLQRANAASLTPATSSEAFADTTTQSQLADQVIVGMGFRFLNDNAVGIFLKTQKLDLQNSSVNASPSFNFTHGTLTSTSANGEIYIQATQGYYIYGFGAGVENSGQDVEVIKVYAARPNKATQSFDVVQCYVTRTGQSGCRASVTLSASAASRYAQYQGSPNIPLVAVGLSVNNAKVTNIRAKGVELSWVNCQ